jgi:hypothetical protein
MLSGALLSGRTLSGWMFLAPGIGLALLLFSANARAAQSPDLAGMVQREIALIQFYGGGSSLSAQERQDASDTIQRAMQQAPQAELAADAGAARLLRALNQGTPALIAQAREGGRLNAQLHEAVDPALRDAQAMEARIIEAHDPVIVFDPTHKRLVTEQTVRILQHADALGASMFNVPPPGPDFTAQMRQAIPRAWPAMDDGMQDALAHAERDLPFAPAVLQAIDPQKRAGFVQTWRTRIMVAPDAAGQQLNLAEVMAVVGMTAYRRGQTGGGGQGMALADRQRMQDLTNRQLLGAVRSYSPTCNVTRPDAMANFSYCHP